ncbi:MAG: CopG family transcriptional regulator [Lachnospiraceae bacterium]|nr:CopG family transcriptional regulator [Lachnospiraceae bacterium]
MNKKSENLILHTKRPKGEDGYKTFSVRIKEETVTKIEEVAKRTGHTRNELIGIFLEYAVDHCEIED